MVPSSISRSETPGVAATISAAWSALALDVMNTLASQSRTMYESSPLVRRDDAAV